MAAESLWDMEFGVQVGVFSGAAVGIGGSHVAYNSGRDLTIQQAVDPALLLVPIDDVAVRICRRDSRHIPVRVLGRRPDGDGHHMRYTIEAVVDPPTRYAGGDIRVWIHDLVLDDESRRLRTTNEAALEALGSRLGFTIGSTTAVLVVRWDDSSDVVGLITRDGMIADCSVRADGWLLSRLRPYRPSPDDTSRTTQELLIGQMVLTGQVPQRMARRGPTSRETLGGRLWPVYARATLAEFVDLADTALSTGLLPLVRSADPLTGSWAYRLENPSGRPETSSIVAGPPADMKRDLEGLRRAFQLPDDTSRLVALDSALSLLRKNKRGNVTAVGLTFTGGDPPGDALAVALDVGALTQAHRRWSALRRYQWGDRHGPLAVVLGTNAPPSLRRTVTVTDHQIDRALGVRATHAQASAIRVALNSPDVALIQGPPGTGKTQVIGAIRRLLWENDDQQSGIANVMLAGTQNETVDNLVRSQIRPDSIPADRRATFDKRRNSGTQLDAWAQDWSHRLTEASLEAPSSLAVLRGTVRDCASRAASQGNAAWPGIRDELSASLRDHFPDLQIDRWLESLHGPPDPTEFTPQQQLLIQLIRTDPSQYQDDGRFTIRRLLESLDPASVPIDLTLLHELARRSKDPTKEQLRSLGKVKSVLLTSAIAHTGIPKAAADALAAIAEAVEAKKMTSAEDALVSLQTLAEQLRTHPAAVDDLVEQFADARAVTCQTAVTASPEPDKPRSAPSSAGYESRITLFETVIVDEASRTPPVDLLISAEKARRRVILVGDQRQLPHFMDDSVRSALNEDDTTVFANPLFAALFDELKQRQTLDGVSRVVTLTDQFRMHPRLGAFVSREFYEPEVKVRSARPSNQFPESIAAADRRVAMWIDVESPAASRPSNSWHRPAESAAIAAFLREVLTGEPDLSVGVISFYAAQVATTQEHLQQAGFLSDSLAATPESNPMGIPDRLWVGTVDACQGREFDVVILSCVRTRDGDGGYGHLSDPNRMCVALSRARRLVTVVGDRRHFASERGAEEVPWLYDFSALCDVEAAQFPDVDA